MKQKFDLDHGHYHKKSIKKYLIAAGILLIIAIIVIPITVVYTNNDEKNEKEGNSKQRTSTRIPNHKSRIECSIQGSSNETMCKHLGCLWMPSSNEPDCFLPLDYGYDTENIKIEEHYIEAVLKRKSKKSLYGNPIDRVLFRMDFLNNQVLRFKFTDADKSRYEVPIKLQKPQVVKTIDRMYDVNVSDDTDIGFNFKITRTSTKEILWDTRIGGLIFEDQFIQIATKLPSDRIYGFGENTHRSFKHDMNYVTWPMFSRDDFPGGGERNLYGVHPFYTCLEKSGNSHGVFLLNSNAIDYTMMPAPALTYRTIGGILDFHMFLGPEPETVISQYTEVIGRPMIPPYWALGFQLCRYGYKTLDELKEAVARTKDNGIPQDIQYGDIDYMEERKDFTYDKVNYNGFPEFIESSKKNNLRFILILDPALITNNSNYKPYIEGKEKDVFIKWPDNLVPEDISNLTDGHNFMLGYVWPKGKVAFPDFLNNVTRKWWIDTLVDFRNLMKYDGLWIDMNEPANFGTNAEVIWNWPKGVEPWTLKCPTSKYDNPPYIPKAAYVRTPELRLSQKTLCMIAEQNNGKFKHYDVHSLYGWSQTEPTLKAAQIATQERSIVISRSTYPSSGKYSGHWLGDNTSDWPFMHDSIIGMLEFNLFGIPYIGADICGFFGDTTKSLCLRWMQLGAFYPFCRNHNAIGQIPQDPGILGPDVVNASKEALEIRYTLLPFLYTLFYKAHVYGETVVRPIFHEFPNENMTHNLDTQFLWGASFMIAPVLKPNITNLEVYLPTDKWYEYKTRKAYKGPLTSNFDVSDNKMFPLFLRAGHITPAQNPAMNTVESRKNPLNLIVTIDKDQKSSGNLFWDDGVSLATVENKKFNYFAFEFQKNELRIKKLNQYNSSEILKLDKVELIGFGFDPSTVLLNNMTIPNNQTSYSKEESILEISSININLLSQENLWEFQIKK